MDSQGKWITSVPPAANSMFRIEGQLTKIQAIWLFRKISNLGLAQSKRMIETNFPEAGQVRFSLNVRFEVSPISTIALADFGEFVAAWIAANMRGFA